MSNSSFEKALLRLCPLGDSKSRGLRAGIVATAPTVYAKHGITTLLVAQIGHECDAGHEVVETVKFFLAVATMKSTAMSFGSTIFPGTSIR